MSLPKRHIKSHVKQEFQKICRFFTHSLCGFNNIIGTDNVSFLKTSLRSEKYKRITKNSKAKQSKKSTKIIKSNALIWFAINE